MAVKLNSPSGSVNLVPEDGAGNVDVTIPRAGVMSEANVLSLFNASGSAPVYACRAWVNFNGTGAITINASGNVSSITDNGVGRYIINMAVALQDSNYEVQGTCVSPTFNDLNRFLMVEGNNASPFTPNLKTTTAVAISHGYSNVVSDVGDGSISIRR